jgi:hypothetical protein
MSDQTIKFQARIYVYDLNNCAREFGFKADENWKISMVSGAEKAFIERQYFPTLSASVQPEMLGKMCSSVKYNLSQHLDQSEKALNTAEIRSKHLQYLVAYSPKRLTLI